MHSNPIRHSSHTHQNVRSASPPPPTPSWRLRWHCGSILCWWLGRKGRGGPSLWTPHGWLTGSASRAWHWVKQLEDSAPPCLWPARPSPWRRLCSVSLWNNAVAPSFLRLPAKFFGLSWQSPKCFVTYFSEKLCFKTPFMDCFVWRLLGVTMVQRFSLRRQLSKVGRWGSFVLCLWETLTARLCCYLSLRSNSSATPACPQVLRRGWGRKRCLLFFPLTDTKV